MEYRLIQRVSGRYFASRRRGMRFHGSGSQTGRYMVEMGACKTRGEILSAPPGGSGMLGFCHKGLSEQPDKQ
jgi:hypothetical protein